MTSGFERQGPGQADALAHAAGELGRLLVLDALGQADLLAAGRRRSASSSPRSCMRVLARAEGDVLDDRHAVEQRRLLEQEAEAEPRLRQLVLAQLRQVAAVELDRAARRPQQARSSA